MSRASQDEGERTADAQEIQAISTFLRSMATLAEKDPVFAAHLAVAMRESGLLGHKAGGKVQGSRHGMKKWKGTAQESRQTEETGAAPDPFVVWRHGGEAGLRATLEPLDIATLRKIVRTHRLDPARISARWTSRERVIALIIEQVRAQANHGKAFAQI